MQNNKAKSSLAQINKIFENIKSIEENIKHMESQRDSLLNSFQKIHDEINSLKLEIKQQINKKKELIELHGEGLIYFHFVWNSFSVTFCSTDIQLTEKLGHYYEETKKVMMNIRACENKKNILLHQKQDHCNELQMLKEESTQLENVYQKKLNWLQTRHADAYKATIWLDENKHRFKGDVFKPMILEVNQNPNLNFIF